MTPDSKPGDPGAVDGPWLARTAFETALAAIEAAHASEVRALRDRIDAAELFRVSVEAQLTDANSRANRAEVPAITERARADQERQQVNKLRGRLEKARDEARVAQETAEVLRRANEAKKAHSRLARLLVAWRGR